MRQSIYHLSHPNMEGRLVNVVIKTQQLSKKTINLVENRVNAVENRVNAV